MFLARVVRERKDKEKVGTGHEKKARASYSKSVPFYDMEPASNCVLPFLRDKEISHPFLGCRTKTRVTFLFTFIDFVSNDAGSDTASDNTCVGLGLGMRLEARLASS